MWFVVRATTRERFVLCMNNGMPVHVQRSNTIVKVVLLGSSLEETLKITSDKFGAEIVELQSLKGAVIDDVHVLRYAKPFTCS